MEPMVLPGTRPAPTPLRPLLGRRACLRLLRWLRLLLLALAVAGLSPLAQAAELLLDDAHPAADAAPSCSQDCDPGCDDSGCDDAGCHGARHHCGCCSPMPRVAASSAWRPGARTSVRAPPVHRALRGPPDRAPPPPWQPPRA